MRIIAGEAFGSRSPLDAPHPMICVDAGMKAEAEFHVAPSYAEQAMYIATGHVEFADRLYQQGQLVVLAPGEPATVRAKSNARLILLGGEPLDEPRHIWWNFVSSSKERIEQAKDDWKQRRFPEVPGETDFIPLPE